LGGDPMSADKQDRGQHHGPATRAVDVVRHRSNDIIPPKLMTPGLGPEYDPQVREVGIADICRPGGPGAVKWTISPLHGHVESTEPPPTRSRWGVVPRLRPWRLGIVIAYES
jgi:hypothetical protein